MNRNVRIISTDNFGMSGECPGKDEHFLLWPMGETAAKAICDALNSEGDDCSPSYYKVVPFDYQLQIFEP